MLPNTLKLVYFKENYGKILVLYLATQTYTELINYQLIYVYYNL